MSYARPFKLSFTKYSISQISKWTFGSGTDFFFFVVHFRSLSLIYTVKYFWTVYQPNTEWEKLWVDQNVDILIWVAIS